MKRLSGWDLLLLSSETPNVHQHTLKVAVVDTTGFQGEATFDAFREVFRAGLHVLEPLRYQLVKTPWRLHRPIWREDAELDLDYHLQRVRVPAPGDRRQLDAVISTIASEPLDRSRPLWQFYYAEGLADQRVAVIGKVHHVLADGVASANLMARVMEGLGTGPVETRATSTASPPTSAEVVRFAVRDHFARLRSLPSAVRAGVIGGYRLQRRARQRDRHPQLAVKFKPPPTFFNHKLSATRVFVSTAVPLGDVEALSKRLEVTINDLVLTTAAGALRRVLLDHGEPADEPLIASVPTATDTSPDRISGNALATMLVSLPVQAEDPMERLRLIRTSTHIAKEDHQLLGPTLVSQWLEFVPPAVTRATFRWMSRREAPNKLFNLIVSNVRGPRASLNAAGAVVTEFYSVGPLAAGAALNMTVWSYVDQLSVAVLADANIFRDGHELTNAFRDAFTELLKAAGLLSPGV
ncbi:wax ester/triacylglycerol synthase family O-acyltransferase [Mycobacterium sp. NPDC051804]|uniref:wax ester/triacylglycerol synthase family O-acyltransferase n=1 Tax=Mycobacterium sp. NPDC051804 TaxID=3364295 RepID=UPI0037BBA9FB